MHEKLNIQQALIQKNTDKFSAIVPAKFGTSRGFSVAEESFWPDTNAYFLSIAL